MNMIRHQHNHNCMLLAPDGGSSGAVVRTMLAMLSHSSDTTDNGNDINTEQAGIDEAWAPLSHEKSAALSRFIRKDQSVVAHSFAKQS